MNDGLRKIGSNAVSVLTSDVTNRATSFVIYALVARHLGAFQFGQLSLALSLFYVFQVTAVAGMKLFTIREVAKDRSQTRLYLINGCAIVTAASLVSLAALFGFVRIMHYEAATSLFILALSLGLLPYAISSVCEAIFQAWERMEYIAYINVPINCFKMVCAYVILSTGRGLYAVILVLLAAFFAVAAVELWLVMSRFPAQKASIRLPFCWRTIRSSATFLAIDKVVAIESSLNIILLSKLATEREVGLYSAATQLMVPLSLIYQSIAQSIYPVMCRKAQTGYQSLRRISERSIEVLLALALPTVAGIFFLGEWILSVLYKNPAFVNSVPVLRIIVWILVLQVFTNVLGQVLLASHREMVTLRIVIVDVAVTLAAGLPLISVWGLRGAAVTLLLTRFVACIQHYIPVERLLSGISLAKISWKSLVAGAGMVAYLIFFSGRMDMLTGISATSVYLAILFALMVWTSGGFRRFREKYQMLLS